MSLPLRIMAQRGEAEDLTGVTFQIAKWYEGAPWPACPAVPHTAELKGSEGFRETMRGAFSPRNRRVAPSGLFLLTEGLYGYILCVYSE